MKRTWTMAALLICGLIGSFISSCDSPDPRATTSSRSSEDVIQETANKSNDERGAWARSLSRMIASPSWLTPIRDVQIHGTIVLKEMKKRGMDSTVDYVTLARIVDRSIIERGNPLQ